MYERVVHSGIYTNAACRSPQRHAAAGFHSVTENRKALLQQGLIHITQYSDKLHLDF